MSFRVLYLDRETALGLSQFLEKVEGLPLLCTVLSPLYLFCHSVTKKPYTYNQPGPCDLRHGNLGTFKQTDPMESL